MAQIETINQYRASHRGLRNPLYIPTKSMVCEEKVFKKNILVVKFADL